MPHAPVRSRLLRRAPALALTIALAAACSSDRAVEPPAERVGDLAVLTGRVTYRADQPVAHALVTAVAHRNSCGAPDVIARAGAPSNANGDFRVRLTAPPADSLCVVLHAEWTLGTTTRAADDAVIVRRAPAGVYDTVRVDLTVQ
jgi:hypothetical protein